MNDTAVLTGARVHVIRFDDVDGRGNKGSAETSRKSGGQVAEEAVLKDFSFDETFLDGVVADEFSGVYN